MCDTVDDDRDRDGIFNDQDSCPDHFNLNTDLDRDGIDDVCDPSVDLPVDLVLTDTFGRDSGYEIWMHLPSGTDINGSSIVIYRESGLTDFWGAAIGTLSLPNGANLRIEMGYKNLGLRESPDSQVQVYLSYDESYDVFDTLVQQYNPRDHEWTGQIDPLSQNVFTLNTPRIYPRNEGYWLNSELYLIVRFDDRWQGGPLGDIDRSNDEMIIPVVFVSSSQSSSFRWSAEARQARWSERRAEKRHARTRMTRRCARLTEKLGEDHRRTRRVCGRL